MVHVVLEEEYILITNGFQVKIAMDIVYQEEMILDQVTIQELRLDMTAPRPPQASTNIILNYHQRLMEVYHLKQNILQKKDIL